MLAKLVEIKISVSVFVSESVRVSESDNDDADDNLGILHICRGHRGHCPWRIFSHVENFEMWRQFFCGEIPDV